MSAVAIEAPRYRVIEDICYPNGSGVPHRRGQILKAFKGRPMPHMLEADNPSGARVLNYFKSFGLNPFCPKSPYNEITGDIFLPATLPYGANPLPNQSLGSTLAGPVPDERVSDDMPKYRNASSRPERCGQATIAPGEVFTFLGWPEPDWMVFANRPGEIVQSYFHKYRDNPRLLFSPWCLYRDGLALPELSALKGRCAGESMQAPSFDELCAEEVQRLGGGKPNGPHSGAYPSGVRNGIK